MLNDWKLLDKEIQSQNPNDRKFYPAPLLSVKKIIHYKQG